MSTIYDVIRRPIITEKGLTLKEQDNTLCFEVADSASKTQIREAVERIFKVKVQAVRTKLAGKQGTHLSQAQGPVCTQQRCLEDALCSLCIHGRSKSLRRMAPSIRGQVLGVCPGAIPDGSGGVKQRGGRRATLLVRP